MEVKNCAEEMGVQILLEVLQDSEGWEKVLSEEYDELVSSIKSGSSANKINNQLEDLLEECRNTAFAEGMAYGVQLYIELTKNKRIEL